MGETEGSERWKEGGRKAGGGGERQKVEGRWEVEGERRKAEGRWREGGRWKAKGGRRKAKKGRRGERRKEKGERQKVSDGRSKTNVPLDLTSVLNSLAFRGIICLSEI
jgi:hypothetical protein